MVIVDLAAGRTDEPAPTADVDDAWLAAYTLGLVESGMPAAQAIALLSVLARPACRQRAIRRIQANPTVSPDTRDSALQLLRACTAPAGAS